MSPDALERLAPEAVPGVRLLPVVHARAEMAAIARAVLDAADPAAVAVELPTTFDEPVARAIARLPRVSLVLAHPEREGEEAVVWTAAPADPFAEALRWAAERGRPGLLVDPDVPYPERHADPVPDPYAVLEIGPADYLGALVAAVAAEPADAVSEADRRREQGMAYHLRRALAELREERPEATLVALVGAAHVRRLASALAGPVAAPFARPRRQSVELRHVEPRSLTALLPDPPLAHAAWELLRRGELPPEPALDEAASEPVSIARAGLTLLAREVGEDAAARRHRVVEVAAHRAARELPGLPGSRPAPDRAALARTVWAIAARSFTRQTREEVAPWQRRIFFDFGRRLARIEGGLVPALLGWVTAARGVGDDNLAWEVLETARTFPWQEGPAEIRTVSVDGDELDLPDSLGTRRVRFRRRHFRIKRRPVAVPVRERATTDDPGEWLEGFRSAGGICSYPPEDLVVEGFGRHLRARAKGLLAAENERSEPFSTSLLDGIDVRETLRHPEDPRIWVRELGRAPGEAGSVVVIFDRDLPESSGGPAEGGPGGERYPYRMTWLGEHHDESDMAFYATDPAAQVVGPGILRATYGAFVMTLPPGRLFDVWSDPDYRPLQQAGQKADVLVAAAIDYSEEKLVVHVAERPPGPALHRHARSQRKRLVHIPLGSLSPTTLKKIRTLHILAGRDKRRIAKRYVW